MVLIDFYLVQYVLKYYIYSVNLYIKNMALKKYRVWVKLKDDTIRTRRGVTDLVNCFQHFDKDLDWKFSIVYDGKGGERLGIYFNYPNNITRPLNKQEL